MKSFSKYPVFFALLILLIVAFLGMFGYNILLFSQNSDAAKNEERASRRFVSALKADPGEEELAKAKANIVAIKERLEFLDKDLSRESTKILAPSPVKEGHQLTVRIMAMVKQWRNEAAQRQIGIPADYFFSFKKYLDAGVKPPADAAVEPLWRQASILDSIMRKLFASKKDESPLTLISVQREILQIELDEEIAAAAASGRRGARPARTIISNTGDTFKVDEAISAAKDGNINTIGYRIVFASYSDTMRRFLNELNSYDLMLVVRSIEVKPTVATTAAPAKAEEQAEEESFPSFEDADTASSSMADQVKPGVMKDPVVSENLSEFTIVIEFVEVAKDAPKKEVSEDKEAE
jgi:hypothetical protein